MRLRAVIASAVTAAVSSVGLLAVTPATANAASVSDNLSCRSNANHSTSSGVTWEWGGPSSLLHVRWNTNAAFKADRITWSGLYAGTWVVKHTEGGSSDTLNDVAASGSALTLNVGNPPSKVRMSVFDQAWGNCSVTVDL